MQRYFTNLAVSLSILLNATIDLSLFRGSFGKRYEMLSSRAYRCEWWFVVSIIDWWFELALTKTIIACCALSNRRETEFTISSTIQSLGEIGYRIPHPKVIESKIRRIRGGVYNVGA